MVTDLDLRLLAGDLPRQPSAVRAPAGGEYGVLHLERVLAGPDHLLGADPEALAADVHAAVEEHAAQALDIEDHELGRDHIAHVDDLDVPLRDADSGLGAERDPFRSQGAGRLDHEDVAGRNVESARAVVVDAIRGDLDGVFEARAIRGARPRRRRAREQTRKERRVQDRKDDPLASERTDAAADLAGGPSRHASPRLDGRKLPDALGAVQIARSGGQLACANFYSAVVSAARSGATSSSSTSRRSF